MTGSVQSKNGMLYLVLNYVIDGKQKRKWISTGLSERGNKRKAQEMLKAELERCSGTEINYATMPYHEYLAYWLSVHKDNVRPNTYSAIHGNLKNHAIPYFKTKNLRLMDITSADLDDFYTYLSKCPRCDGKPGFLSARTIRHNHTTMSAALSYAVKHRYIKYNPAAGATPPHAKKYIGKTIELDDVHQLLELIKGSPLEVPVTLIAFYGLRRSEAVGLKWRCVDLKKRELTIECAAIESRGNGVVDADTKTEESTRIFPIPDNILELLTEEKKWQDKESVEFARYGFAFNPDGYVCMHRDGTRITPNYLSRNFKEFMREHGLPEIRLHDLRHTVASNLFEMGYTPKEVQEWLGHSSAKTTLDTYSHVVNKDSKKFIAQSLMTGNSKYESISEAKRPDSSASRCFPKVLDLSQYRKSGS